MNIKFIYKFLRYIFRVNLYTLKCIESGLFEVNLYNVSSPNLFVKLDLEKYLILLHYSMRNWAILNNIKIILKENEFSCLINDEEMS